MFYLLDESKYACRPSNTIAHESGLHIADDQPGQASQACFEYPLRSEGRKGVNASRAEKHLRHVRKKKRSMRKGKDDKIARKKETQDKHLRKANVTTIRYLAILYWKRNMSLEDYLVFEENLTVLL